MSLFRGLFVFAMNTKRFFFSLISTDVISDATELRIMFFIFVHSLYLFFIFFSCKQLVLQDLERCMGGGRELLPYLTLRRC